VRDSFPSHGSSTSKAFFALRISGDKEY